MRKQLTVEKRGDRLRNFFRKFSYVDIDDIIMAGLEKDLQIVYKGSIEEARMDAGILGPHIDSAKGIDSEKII